MTQSNYRLDPKDVVSGVFQLETFSVFTYVMDDIDQAISDHNDFIEHYEFFCRNNDSCYYTCEFCIDTGVIFKSPVIVISITVYILE